MLPNLKSIDLRSYLFKFSGYLHELLAATKPWIDYAQKRAKRLQVVEYINVEHWDTEGSEELVGIGDLIYLPNLKELRGLSLEHGYWNDKVEPVLSEYSTGILLGEQAPDDFDMKEYRKGFVRLAHDWLEEHGLVTEAINAEEFQGHW